MIMMPAPRVARGLPSPPPETRSSSPLAVHIPFDTVRRGEKKKKANASPRRLPCVDAATATNESPAPQRGHLSRNVPPRQASMLTPARGLVINRYRDLAWPANPPSRKFLERRAEPDSSPRPRTPAPRWARPRRPQAPGGAAAAWAWASRTRTPPGATGSAPSSRRGRGPRRSTRPAKSLASCRCSLENQRDVDRPSAAAAASAAQGACTRPSASCLSAYAWTGAAFHRNTRIASCRGPTRVTGRR